MNLTRVLNNALPEIPARTLSERYPRLDPGTTFREHIEDGQAIIRIYVPCAEAMFTLPPQQWELAKLFDGIKSYKEIAELYSQESGVLYDEEEVRDFAAELDAAEFLYKTPQEKNISLMQQTAEERRKLLQVKGRWADLSMVLFPAFNPDGFLTWFYGKTRFVYTWWFTLLTLVTFGMTVGIFVTHWSEVGRDTIEFYTFSNKTWGDILLLYAVSMIVVAFHEMGHAYACVHYGAHVRSMGFAMVYLMPAFFTDTTEAVVMATRWQRFVIAVAGIWAELILCAVATPIWWGTPPDTPLHDAAYYMMMQTGIMSLVLNWNPLIKLDGYHMLCETLGISDLKEKSTAYVSSWVKRHLWKLPVEVPYVPKRRRAGFVVYALLSGAYSYMVLFIVARFAGNVVRNFSPEWGFIPEIAVALLIFRSRIRTLVNFMKFVYLDKREHVRAWFTVRRTVGAALAALVLLVTPLRRESVSGKFMLEPLQKIVVRAHVPGMIDGIYVQEGQAVTAGAPLATLKNIPLDSQTEQAKARYLLAAEQERDSSLHYQNVGNAIREREQFAVQAKQLADQREDLKVRSPIAGTVLSSSLSERVWSFLPAGAELLEIGDLSQLRAQIYISEFELGKVHNAELAKIQVNGLIGTWKTETVSIASTPSEMDPLLQPTSALKGMNPPHYYLVALSVKNADGKLKPGMTGVARIYGERRSLASEFWRSVGDFFGRKLW
jgi:putative peptide zinc metalloprotease protein